MSRVRDSRQGVFHITTASDWERAQVVGSLRPRSLESEGFVHCSTAEQVLPTAERLFRGRLDLVLLRLDARQLEADLRYEAPVPPLPDEPAARFPHLYTEVPVEAVVSAQPLAPREDGGFDWPEGA